VSLVVSTNGVDSLERVAYELNMCQMSQ